MFRILSATQDPSITDRLIAAVDGVATVVRSDPSLPAIQDGLNVIRPDMIVIDIDDSQNAIDRACDAIRILHEADHLRPIIAIGNDAAASAVLQTMRAGAHDFVGRDVSKEVLRRQIVAQFNRLTREARPAFGRLVVIASGQPNDGESFFAINYAVLRAKAVENVLLIDFHLPSSEAGAALDIELNYTVRDAVNELSRIDRTLLSSALGKHRASGLFVLPLAASSDNAMDFTGASILSLMTTLRSMFGEIIVNLGGLRHTGLLTQLLNAASDSYLVASQHFTSVKACRELLLRLSPDAKARGRITLVISNHDPEIRLSDGQMVSTLGLTKSVRLPHAHAALANALNQGVPLVLDQPRSAYSKAVIIVAEEKNVEIEAATDTGKPPRSRLMRRLRPNVI